MPAAKKRGRDDSNKAEDESEHHATGSSSKEQSAKTSGDTESKDTRKIASNQDDDSSDDEVVGPAPGPIGGDDEKRKKRRILRDEDIYLKNIPTTESYEKSFMHKESITHLLVTKSTDFLVTGSAEGAVKFWKKQPIGIEFVKHFRSHLGPIQDMSANVNGTLLATVCADERDRTLKVFDVINFDMINMIKFTTTEFIPSCVEWIHSIGDPLATIAVSSQNTAEILVYDGRGDGQAPPLHTIKDTFHRSPVVTMRFNSVYSTMISVDSSGILDYWMTPSYDFKFPEQHCTFSSKLDTDLFLFATNHITPHCLSISPNGDIFGVISDDRKVRLFRFKTGKLLRVYDEALQQITSLQQMKSLMPNMEFGRRMAVERELEKQPLSWRLESIEFDASGYFIIYPTLLGIKVINWYTNRLVRLLGKGENFRPLKVALFQNLVRGGSRVKSAEAEAAENPLVEALNANPDPTLFCSAYKKNRFYIFSCREPEESETGIDRDVFNEKPSREDIISATELPSQQNLFSQCTIHTTMGDIHATLFYKECPKTVENFCVHSKNGYYNGHIFHRVMKQFMIQTGDPTGTGTGGESIWGGEFADEIVPDLKHNKPYTLSMANAGPNTNGSQFFITVIPCPWLDGKHTVFGRLTRGMEVAQNISNAKTNPKTDKPYNDIKIINISLS